MIQEAYVSFEIAKLLKEKGFDENTLMVYMSYGDLCKCNRYDSIRNSNYNDITKNYFECTAPTLQMAMKWLREIHNKHCDIGYDIDLHWFFQIIDLKKTVEYDYPETKYYHTENETGFNSYEEAVEAALKYCLNNLI